MALPHPHISYCSVSPFCQIGLSRNDIFNNFLFFIYFSEEEKNCKSNKATHLSTPKKNCQITFTHKTTNVQNLFWIFLLLDEAFELKIQNALSHWKIRKTVWYYMNWKTKEKNVSFSKNVSKSNRIVPLNLIIWGHGWGKNH